MLSPEQVKIVKMAQREAGLSDLEYREALALFGATSSKDPHLADEHFDKLLAYFEAIYWQKTNMPGRRVFRARGYWKNKNFSTVADRKVNSRDRYTVAELAERIVDLETQLAALGKGEKYCEAIRRNVGMDASAGTLFKYVRALERTLAAQQRKAVSA